MLRTFHAQRRLRAATESSLLGVFSQLNTRQLASVEAHPLQRVETDVGGFGSKPIFLIEDDRHTRYMFKLADPELMAAEVAAYEIRSLGARPCVPAKIVKLTLDELGEVRGLLKPYIAFDASRELTPDTQSWTALQRAIVLMDHAWDWFLDNLDTNTSQYALLGSASIPVNFDWDRSFSSECQSQLSRFAKYKPTIPNAHTFIYADYVEGRIDLPFELLLSEARRIRRLPMRPIRAALERFAAVRYADRQAQEEFVLRALSRKQRIELEFAHFVRSLVIERHQLLGRHFGIYARLRHWLATLWKHWQVVLHRATRGPLGSLGRMILRFVRGRRLLSRGSEKPGSSRLVAAAPLEPNYVE